MKSQRDIESLLEVAANIGPLDADAMEQARLRQLSLTKPAGSLGRLEDLAIHIAGIKRSPRPEIKRKVVFVMAGDHGVTVEGVSAYPSAVTAQMVHNFLRGGAAINALAYQNGAEVIVVDIGVEARIDHPALVVRKVAPGTRDMMVEPAMTQEEMVAAISIGMDVLEEQAEQGLDLVATGEMGIGNTTAASAISAALLQVPVAQVTGRGTGVNDEQLAHKVQVIEQALKRNVPDVRDPFDVLRKVGGLEIAGLVGVIIQAAASRIPVVLDGFIAGAAALVAVSLNPRIADYLIAGHLSVERGHALILNRLGREPLLNLGLRLGEGTGAVLAMNIIEAALQAHNRMLTFAEAGVSTANDEDN